jgi:hypothetical protein
MHLACYFGTGRKEAPPTIPAKLRHSFSTPNKITTWEAAFGCHRTHPPYPQQGKEKGNDDHSHLSHPNKNGGREV